MATAKSNATPETVFPDSAGARGTGDASPEYTALIEFCLAAEKDDQALRIIEIVTDDKTAPEYQRLHYSYPIVTIGTPGYKDSKDKVVSYK